MDSQLGNGEAMKALVFIDNVIFLLLRAGASAGVACILALISYGIVARQIEGASIAWADEIIEPAIGWIVFLSAAALWRERSLFTVNLLDHVLPDRLRTPFYVIVELLCLLFAATVLIQGWKFTATSVEDSPFLNVSKTYWYAAIPVAGALMTAYSIRDLIVLFMRGRPKPEVTTPLTD